MTVAARIVLEDCRGALADLREGVQGGEWRRRWIAAVTLLRVVGHVLDKVDGRREPRLKAAIYSAHQRVTQSKPDPVIFWDFIDGTRNAILKEYCIRAGQGVTVRPGRLTWDRATGELDSLSSGPTTFSYTINEGAFAGRDQREVIAEAIEWWERYLDRVDSEAEPQSPAT